MATTITFLVHVTHTSGNGKDVRRLKTVKLKNLGWTPEEIDRNIEFASLEAMVAAKKYVAKLQRADMNSLDANVLGFQIRESLLEIL